jgi:hypothetical protein
VLPHEVDGAHPMRLVRFQKNHNMLSFVEEPPESCSTARELMHVYCDVRDPSWKLNTYRGWYFENASKLLPQLEFIPHHEQ